MAEHDPLEVLTAAEASILLGITEDAVLARQRAGLISATPTLTELAPDAALDQHAAARAHAESHDTDEGIDIEAHPADSASTTGDERRG